MPKVGAKGRQWLRGLHFLLAGIWVGGGLALFLLQGAAKGGEEVYGVTAAMRLVDDAVIIPGALGSLISGLLLSWLTPWGFFKHRWITVKLALNVAAIIFGTFWLGPWVNGQAAIAAAERAAALTNPAYLYNAKMNYIFGGVQVAVIMALFFVSALKPWGKGK